MGKEVFSWQKNLIVDDEPTIVKGLKYSLEQDGYETDVAYDGEEALEKVFANDYDLVPLDDVTAGRMRSASRSGRRMCRSSC